MTTATLSGSARSMSTSVDQRSHAARRLQVGFAGVRLSISWLGVRKTLTTDQKAQAADTFGAEGGFLSAAKKILDTSHPAYKALTTLRGQAVHHWRSLSLPYPEPGLRLIRHEDIEGFDTFMSHLRGELEQAVIALDQVYAQLRERARDRLGRLYNPADYPPSLRGLFALDWEFPGVEPPEYLRRLNPQLYEQERQRVAARFDQAVELAQQAFVGEFARLVAHITQRLGGQGGDDKPKVFRDSAVMNLRAFFDRFRQLNVHSSQELDDLVDQAQAAVRGVAPQALRDSQGLRAEVARQLTAVQASLEDLMVERPRRRILRAGTPTEALPEEGA